MATTAAAASPIVSSPAARELFEDAACRRLLKARHQDLLKMEIRTKVMFATLYADAGRFTVYKFKIKSKARAAPAGSEWTIAKRYSEFFLFRQRMLKRIQAMELAMGHNGDAGKKAPAMSKEFALIADCLRAPLATRDFPRKHMRVDTEEIIAERRTKLQELVCKMLDAYADLSVLMTTSSAATEGSSLAAVREMYLQLEAFLDIPKSQKEIDRRQMAAVLALEDVVLAPNTKKERTCCICLDDLDEDDDGEECTASSCCSDSDEMKLVKLPCGHHFHEDCVIDWFNTSTTCPLCRQAPYSEDALSFDVTAN